MSNNKKSASLDPCLKCEYKSMDFQKGTFDQKKSFSLELRLLLLLLFRVMVVGVLFKMVVFMLLFVVVFEMLIMLRLFFGLMMVLNFFAFVDVFISVVVMGFVM